jgi:hypothetical protein
MSSLCAFCRENAAAWNGYDCITILKERKAIARLQAASLTNHLKKDKLHI